MTTVMQRTQALWYGLFCPLTLSLLFFAGWETLSRSAMISPLFFPPPSAIVGHMGHRIMDGTLGTHLTLSMIRLIAGFTLGGTAGVGMGLLMGSSHRLRAVLDPLIAAVHPIPKIAVFPLFMIIFGIGETSKIVIVAVTAFFPLCINTLAGVRQIHPIHFEVARNFGASRWRILRRVVWPGSLPMVLTGMRLALNLALILTTAVELVASDKGLGAMIWLAWETLRIQDLYVAIFTVCLLGIGFNLMVQFLRRLLVPWERPG